MYVQEVQVDGDSSPSFRVTVTLVNNGVEYKGRAKRMSLTDAKEAAVRDAFEEYIKVVSDSITFTVRAELA